MVQFSASKGDRPQSPKPVLRDPKHSQTLRLMGSSLVLEKKTAIFRLNSSPKKIPKRHVPMQHSWFCLRKLSPWGKNAHLLNEIDT
jgi:hypothetical protein